MTRFTKTTLVALAIVAGTTAGVKAQNKTVRLDPISKDVYRFTYLDDGPCHLKVEVFDEEGHQLLSENINQKKSFTKPYSFQNLRLGEYAFKVTDDDGEYVTRIKRTDEVTMVASIKKFENEKAKIIVKGDVMGPVTVNIYDENDVLVFDDYIDEENSFSKVYDLSNVKADDLRIDVITEKKLLASTNF